MDRIPKRTYSYASIADCNVTDGVLTAQSTVTAVSSFTSGDLDGSVVLAGGVLQPPRSLSITRSLATGAYTTDPITIGGKRGGTAVTGLFTPATADGGDTVRTGTLFDSISSISVPEQASTAGQYSVGVEDIGSQCGDTLVAVRMNAAGVLNVAYDEAGAETDSLEPGTVREDIACRRIATANMTQGFTVYYP